MKTKRAADDLLTNVFLDSPEKTEQHCADWLDELEQRVKTPKARTANVVRVNTAIQQKMNLDRTNIHKYTIADPMNHLANPLFVAAESRRNLMRFAKDTLSTLARMRGYMVPYMSLFIVLCIGAFWLYSQRLQAEKALTA